LVINLLSQYLFLCLLFLFFHTVLFPAAARRATVFEHRIIISVTYNNNMSAALIQIPKDATSWCDSLSNLEYPMTISHFQFEEYWPLISTVLYKTRWKKKYTTKWHSRGPRYECRLCKSKKNGNGAIKKRHGRTVREKG
jgi:hypothetical protein